MWVDAALALEHPRALELNLLGSEALEQSAPLPEEHRDDVKLQLVQDAGRQSEPRDAGAVDEHVLVARGVLGPGHCGADVVDICDQRPLGYVDAGCGGGDDKDGHAVVMVAAPAARRLEGRATGDGRAGGHELADDLPVDPTGSADRLEVD